MEAGWRSWARVIALALLVGLVGSAGLALGEEPRWGGTFSDESVAPLLPGRYLAVSVVGRGPSSNELVSAVGQLRSSLCRVAFCSLVDLAGVSDGTAESEVVRAAERAGVDVLMLLRLDPSAAARPSLWLDVLRADGAVIDHFGAVAGEAFERWYILGDGSCVAASSGDEATAAELIHFERSGVRGSLEDLAPFRAGSPRESLAPPAYYDLVGRRDLSERFESLRRRKRVLTGVGVSLLGAGGAAMFGTIVALGNYVGDERGRLALGISGGVAAVGLALLVAGAVIQPYGVSTAESVRLANEWNARQIRASAKRPTSALVPLLDRQAAGVAWVGSF